MGNRNTLSSFIEALETHQDLARIAVRCAPQLEIGEIAHRVMSRPDGGKALLFTNTGTPYPLAINLYGSQQRMLRILRASTYEALSARIDGFISSLTAPRNTLRAKLSATRHLSMLASISPAKTRFAAPCQEIRMARPDLTRLPALTCWPADAAPFLTLPMVITEHPITHARNVGMYRMQIINDSTAAMHWHIHKTGASHYRAYKALGKPMPVAIALGGDPLLAYCATAPLPEGVDEWLMAGFLRRKRVRLTAAKTVPLLVPAEADFIIEGFVDTAAPLFLEGPFGDHTGFYSLPDYYPTLHVTAITHRRNAIYPATIVGVPPMEDAHIALATEQIFNVPLRKTLAPEIVSFSLPTAGVAHNLAIASARSIYPGQAERLANLFWSMGQLMFTKFLLVVDEALEPKNWRAALYATALAARNISRFYHGQGPLDALDHSSPKACEGGKLLLDARGVEMAPGADYSLSTEEARSEDGSAFTLIRVGSQALATVAATRDSSSPITRLAARLLSAAQAPFIILVDSDAPWANPYLLLWLTLANCAPDVDMLHHTTADGSCVTVCDARMKANWPNRRPWPNPVASCEATIKAVDARWASLGLGEPVASPSLAVKGFQRGKNAVAEP